MPLLNYTTKVASKKTISEIHELLVKAGARSVSTRYDDDGDPDGVAFSIVTAYGERSFALPVDSLAVQEVLDRQKVLRDFPQAERVAWRIVKDWLEAQLAIIETEMVTLDQIMLPFMSGDNGQTIYELYRDQQLALEAGS